MFTTTGSRGLYKAPLCKSLLIVPSALAGLLTVGLPQYQSIFSYNLQAIREECQLWRLLCGRLVCLDLKDTFCSSLLIYNFRIFERRYGSRKFASFLLGTWILSALMDMLLVETLHHLFHLKVDVLPSGLLGPVFALFVPFYCSIPQVQVTQIFGQFSITNKSLVYIIGLQLLTSSPFMWVLSLSGLGSGVLYHRNTLKLQHFLLVPGWVARCSSYVLRPLLSASEPPLEAGLGMGATLDIQRQQRMDMLDHQILLSQFAQMRRGHQQQGHLINWSRFFPSLRHRGQNENYAQPQQPARASPPNLVDGLPVSEEQVARLVEMGFSRLDALEALRASNNDINMATNFLLQH
ncbi:ubiquitin-associated domain-containing protein 2 isoform X1 [Brienomyrus brachyistius]|uniref:ubiquitin-associated domain-containing protein 2 isoform X1 n=1 Tax=Brienomyrus brachyistius TaxID=42636 RepID=UPI0020B38D8E|nr:ubiquitin-associated domain-containing protein 2 isoform X1 [Brienomyrus brachyistius]